MPVALRLGPLAVEGYRVVRSGIRWLCADGQSCRAGGVVAFCNVGLEWKGGPRDAPAPFADEYADLQVGFITPVGGRLRQGAGLALGAFHDFQFVHPWLPLEVICQVEPEGDQGAWPADAELRLIAATGRRTFGMAEMRTGLLTGWFERSRASRIDGPGRVGTLLNLGACDMMAIKGDQFAFLEMLDAVRGPAHIVSISDAELIHNSRVVAEQMRRTPAEGEEIAADFARTFAAGATTPDPADWMFGGTVLKALRRSPVTDEYAVLARDGVRKAGPPDAILLSLLSEGSILLRHRRLGYTVEFHRFRMADAGAAFQPWLDENFEPVFRSLDDIAADYRALVELIRARAPATQILVSNILSSSGQDDVQSYAAFDAPLGTRLASISAKERNLMLGDVARDCDIAIIDVDAIAADLGARHCMSDGIHPNGVMAAEMRAEILHILRTRGVRGFEAAN